MRTRSIVAVLLACACLRAGAEPAGRNQPSRQGQAALALQKTFFFRLDLRGSSAQAEAMLRHDPANPAALFVRMEAGELEDRPDRVLDSALRLCRASAPADFQEIASRRVLEHAANSRVFNSLLARVRAAAWRNGACAFNLRLALVAAAADGARTLDLDQSASFAGLLTRWSIAGPFGQHSNIDFERRWPPESDQLSSPEYGPVAAERFWFRDGTVALPDYLSRPGVFYAAAEMEVPREPVLRLEVFGPGPYVVFIDGRPVLTHDSPYVAIASRDSVFLPLRPGRHRVMLKFTADAVPLRVAWHVELATPSSSPESSARQPLQEYARVLLSYFREDLAGMERRLDSSPCHHASACVYLRALLHSATEQHSPLTLAAWESLAQAHPSALLARLRAIDAAPVLDHSQDPDDARKHAVTLAEQYPQSETAAHLAFNLSRGDPMAGTNLVPRLLELRASCAYLSQALQFYNFAGELNPAQLVEQRMEGCKPGSLDYAGALSDSGRHAAAAAVLQQLVSANPLDRAARRLLVEQLVLNNQPDAAREQAQELHRIAPNAGDFLRLAEDPSSALDSDNPRAEGFTRREEFYVPHRRDGMELIRRSAQREFSGGSAVILLSDQAIQLRRDGTISVYAHRITRLLNKDGISRYGEVSVPPGADLLELRTVKSSGQTVEPELAWGSDSISMPALDPGDSIEEEFVSHYSGWDQMPESFSRFEFGSFLAPVLSSRLIVIAPVGARMHFSERNGAPAPRTEPTPANVVHIWERDNIAQTVTESFLPAGALLPTVTMAPTEEMPDRLRDQLIGFTRIGPRAMGTALSLYLPHLPSAASELEKAKLLYTLVTQRIEPAGSDWTTNSANDTLLNSRGSRTLALLALARVSGLQAGLVLAHAIDHSCENNLDVRCYTEPLARFWISGETVDVDAESDGLPFGAVPPSLDSRDAFFIPLSARDEKKPGIVALTMNPAREKTAAEGELSLSRDGDLEASVHVRLGATRTQEVRSQLRGTDARERQAFFEQLARRILPEGTGVTGSVLHENDPEQPLEVTLHWVVPQFVHLGTGTADIDQLAPALGLRGTYARAATRRFPLYTESLFFESTVFRLHLPAGIEVRSLPADFSAKTEFGNYSARFRQTRQGIEIRREFRIPVQIVSPEKYAAFNDFARQIDDAERQRISLEAAKDASTVSAKSKLPQITRK